MDENFRVNFGRMVRAARKERGLTQTDLGEMLDIHRVSINRIESGARGLSFATAFALIKLLEINFDDIEFEEERKK